ncbi:MAG: hypothetical protein M9949_14200 [Candidatus Kapabacteria bacterium]|nr:hypothetical protein [Candidatus Kapabacteria bacterium]
MRSSKKVLVYPEWEKQPKESTIAWEYFKSYRDMGIFRSHRNVAKIFNTPERVDIARRNIGNIAAIWRWTERIDAYQRHLDKIQMEETEKAVKEMASRHADYAKNTIYAAYFPIIELLKKIQRGDTKDITDMSSKELLALTFKSAQVLVSVADLERKTRGEPTDIRKMGLDHTSGGEKIKPSISINVSGSQSNLLKEKKIPKEIDFEEDDD